MRPLSNGLLPLDGGVGLLLATAVSLVSLTPQVLAGTDAERIMALEDRVAAQDALIRVLMQRLVGSAVLGAQSSQTSAAALGAGTNVLHVAASSYYTRSSSTDQAFSFTQKPEAKRALVTISTGTFTARSALFIGGEAAFEHGPFLVQAEGGTLGFYGGMAGAPRF